MGNSNIISIDNLSFSDPEKFKSELNSLQKNTLMTLNKESFIEIEKLIVEKIKNTDTPNSFEKIYHDNKKNGLSYLRQVTFYSVGFGIIRTIFFTKIGELLGDLMWTPDKIDRSACNRLSGRIGFDNYSDYGYPRKFTETLKNHCLTFPSIFENILVGLICASTTFTSKKSDYVTNLKTSLEIIRNLINSEKTEDQKLSSPKQFQNIYPKEKEQ